MSGDMIDFFFLIPIAIGLGLAGLASFMWTLRNGQYDDLEGAAERILFEGHEGPVVERRRSDPAAQRPSSVLARPGNVLE
jgi:cbb3-type cytochrome oxidase maturation protein